jgi:hypothetical protein
MAAHGWLFNGHCAFCPMCNHCDLEHPNLGRGLQVEGWVVENYQLHTSYTAANNTSLRTAQVTLKHDGPPPPPFRPAFAFRGYQGPPPPVHYRFPRPPPPPDNTGGGAQLNANPVLARINEANEMNGDSGNEGTAVPHRQAIGASQSSRPFALASQGRPYEAFSPGRRHEQSQISLGQRPVRTSSSAAFTNQHDSNHTVQAWQAPDHRICSNCQYQPVGQVTIDTVPPGSHCRSRFGPRGGGRPHY